MLQCLLKGKSVRSDQNQHNSGLLAIQEVVMVALKK